MGLTVFLVTKIFDYVVNLVAYYCGSANPETWRRAVERAVELIGTVCEREE